MQVRGELLGELYCRELGQGVTEGSMLSTRFFSFIITSKNMLVISL